MASPFTPATIPSSGVASGEALPTAVGGVTVDATTYNNTVRGSGKLRTLVFPHSVNGGDDVALALAVSSDAFPRVLILSDPTDAVLYIGDGSYDAYNGGPHIDTNSSGDLHIRPGSSSLTNISGTTLVVPAPATASCAARLSSLSSYLTVTSGALANMGAWVSGTAKVNPNAQQITVNVELVGDATNNAATCTIAISPDDSTYTTIGTPSLAAAVNNTGAIKMLVPVNLPQAWFIKLTFSHFTVAASVYY